MRQGWGCETAAPFRTPARSLTPALQHVPLRGEEEEEGAEGEGEGEEEELPVSSHIPGALPSLVTAGQAP